MGNSAAIGQLANLVPADQIAEFSQDRAFAAILAAAAARRREHAAGEAGEGQGSKEEGAESVMRRPREKRMAGMAEMLMERRKCRIGKNPSISKIETPTKIHLIAKKQTRIELAIDADPISNSMGLGRTDFDKVITASQN